VSELQIFERSKVGIEGPHQSRYWLYEKEECAIRGRKGESPRRHGKECMRGRRKVMKILAGCRNAVKDLNSPPLLLLWWNGILFLLLGSSN